jgi:N-methylhydantoinase A/oxoprolinase/acetone carboxylase beta subunit
MRAVTAHPRTTSLPVNMTTKHPLRLAIDIGGTFTDTVLMDGAATVIATAKTATTPADPSEGALEGARIALDIAGADWSDIAGFIHGTTLATNALIERRGAKVATITTRGFRDILEIAYERRYDQYAIDLQKPDLIVPARPCLHHRRTHRRDRDGAGAFRRHGRARPRPRPAGGRDRGRRHLPSARLRQPRP